VVAKHRVRQNDGNGASQPWKQSAQPHEKHPVGRRQPRPRSLPAKHIQLMPQHGDLGGHKMFANDRSIKRDFAVKRRLFIDYRVVSENMLGAIGQLLPGDPRDFDQLRSIDEGIEKWPVIDHSQHGSSVVGFVGHAAMPGSMSRRMMEPTKTVVRTDDNCAARSSITSESSSESSTMR
jgi:hypothetical protein